MAVARSKEQKGGSMRQWFSRATLVLVLGIMVLPTRVSAQAATPSLPPMTLTFYDEEGIAIGEPQSIEKGACINLALTEGYATAKSSEPRAALNLYPQAFCQFVNGSTVGFWANEEPVLDMYAVRWEGIADGSQTPGVVSPNAFPENLIKQAYNPVDEMGDPTRYVMDASRGKLVVIVVAVVMGVGVAIGVYQVVMAARYVPPPKPPKVKKKKLGLNVKKVKKKDAYFLKPSLAALQDENDQTDQPLLGNQSHQPNNALTHRTPSAPTSLSPSKPTSKMTAVPAVSIPMKERTLASKSTANATAAKTKTRPSSNNNNNSSNKSSSLSNSSTITSTITNTSNASSDNTTLNHGSVSPTGNFGGGRTPRNTTSPGKSPGPGPGQQSVLQGRSAVLPLAVNIQEMSRPQPHRQQQQHLQQHQERSFQPPPRPLQQQQQQQQQQQHQHQQQQGARPSYPQPPPAQGQPPSRINPNVDPVQLQQQPYHQQQYRQPRIQPQQTPQFQQQQQPQYPQHPYQQQQQQQQQPRYPYGIPSSTTTGRGAETLVPMQQMDQRLPQRRPHPHPPTDTQNNAQYHHRP